MNASGYVLITGAGGFVCSSIARSLLEQGWQVVAVDRQFDVDLQGPLQQRWGDQIRFIQTDSVFLPDIQVDALVHGAAITASPEELSQSAEANFRANLDPLLSVSEWAIQHRVKRALFISSSAVYAATSGAVNETQPTSPRGLYAVAKQTTESLIATLRSEYGRDVATIRLSNIYGLNEQVRLTRPRVSLIGQLVQQAAQTGRITLYEDDPQRDWTFASDVGGAVNALLKQANLNHALYNIASEQMLSPTDIGMAIKSIMHEVTLDVHSGINPNVPILTRRGYLSHQRLQDETGFTDWTPFEAGLQQVIAEQQAKVVAL